MRQLCEEVGDPHTSTNTKEELYPESGAFCGKLERERRRVTRQQEFRREDEVETVIRRLHDKCDLLERRNASIRHAGEVAKQQVVKHAETMHTLVGRRKESLIRELDRYRIEKERLLVLHKEELVRMHRALAHLQLRGASTEKIRQSLLYAERLLSEPLVNEDLTLELEEYKLKFALQTMGLVSPTTLLFPPGSAIPFPDNRTSIELEQKVSVPLPANVERAITFSAGVAAGIVSAMSTHWLDVAKVLRQVGMQRPTTFSGYFVGLPMGAVAQGQRFGVTLLLHSVLQQKMNEKHFLDLEAGTLRYRLTSICLSVFSASLGEALANPPVVVKNWQIAQNMGTWDSVTSLWKRGKVPIFFRGVVPGVVRKGLANAIVLQTIGPMKGYLESVARDLWSVETSKVSSKVTIGFAAGSITGCAAEVLTNHPDRVKTLMQTKKTTMWQAIAEASRDPFRGAFCAGLRKGTIRGVNWGCLGIFTSMMEEAYKSNHARAPLESAFPLSILGSPNKNIKE